MPANIQVIMQEDVDKVGKSGEFVRVRPGFARNYLLPRQLAVAATTAAVHRIEHDKAVALARSETTKKDAPVALKQLHAVGVQISQNGGDGGHPVRPRTVQETQSTAQAPGVTRK